ncbi:hypothetical protein C6B38_06720 [Spiroplasma sp. ChiS]|uniref:lipoprotein n=1 Tax=Spiroplasma sp. ChiS TaxID=2099885 RepID=UPI000CF8B997|nr:lipoprotein [Spiroplasma sp. ChiS]PQP78339.1 hypothetical protein C6B38_06720 [Spiroplasma sp. ChiS]
MKRILSIIGAIGLTATSTTTLISCEKSEKPNDNNKINKPTTPTPKAQQPPKDSNWKLISNKYISRDTGWYIIIYKSFNLWRIEKINSSKNFGSSTGYPMDIIYKWELNNEPTNLQLPTIDKNTGEITDWKEQKSFNLWRIEKINSSKNFGSSTGYPMDIIYNNAGLNFHTSNIWLKKDKNTGEITDWKEQKGTK